MKMKLYIIEAKEDFNVDYDQFDGFVVRASNKEIAWELAKGLVLSTVFFEQRADYFNTSNFSINELEDKGEEGIILASYNAG